MVQFLGPIIHYALQEAFDRARTSDHHIEWRGRITKQQQHLIEKIRAILNVRPPNENTFLSFAKCIYITIDPLGFIEEKLVRYRLPTSTVPPETLFRLLRDRVGGQARRRGSFAADDLRRSLQNENNIELIQPPDVDTLRTVLRNCSALIQQHKNTFGMTEEHIEPSVVAEIVNWVEVRSKEDHTAILLDQAGMGKTVAMRDILYRLEELDYSVLAIKADIQMSDVQSYDELQHKLGFPEPIERAISRLAECDRVVVLIDQIDALSLSLARDERALNIAVELISRLQSISGVTTLISCRTFDRNSDPRLIHIASKQDFRLSQLTDEEIAAVIKHLGIDIKMLTPATRDLLRIPLHLDLFVRSIEGNAPGIQVNQGIERLQALYDLLWHNVILRPIATSPSFDERTEAIRCIVQRMYQEQQTTVPDAMFDNPAMTHLRPAVAWLASVGILIQGQSNWSFLHQTFFDYCYARRFVESGGSLSRTILESVQGLRERPQILQVLSYQRVTNRRAYLNDLSTLLRTNHLRFHLQDLVFRWFGSLPKPNDDEWILAQRLFNNSSKRRRLLISMHGKQDWFAKINGPVIQELLALDDEALDTEVVPYLSSLTKSAQPDVALIIRPFVGRSERWNNRVVWLLSGIRHWHSVEALDLYEHVLREIPASAQSILYEIDTIAKTSPQHGCRIIKLLLDRVLDQYMVKLRNWQNNSQNDSSLPHPSLAQDLEVLNKGMFLDALAATSNGEPRLFLELMLPWVYRVLKLAEDQNDPVFFRDDVLSIGWRYTMYVVLRGFVMSLITALTSLAHSDREAFLKIANHLAAWPLITPQVIVTRAYTNAAELNSRQALLFLLNDQRRLGVGDANQYDACRLVEAISPYLSKNQQIELESYILGYNTLLRHRDVRMLRLSGLGQLHLLQAIPENNLTIHGIRRLNELRRKFPDSHELRRSLEVEVFSIVSPISIDDARKMKDKDWIGAMSHYHGNVNHKDYHKGGANELSGVLTKLVREEPERFFQLALQIPEATEDTYVQAFVSGLADSTASLEELCTVIRRFGVQEGRNIQQAIAWAIEKRIEQAIPDDILDILETIATGSFQDDEIISDEPNNDPYNRCLNSNRGVAFIVLTRALAQREATNAKERIWDLVEFAAADTSTALRAGAIAALLQQGAEIAIVW